MKLDLNAPLSAKWRRDELWSQWQVEYNLLKTKPWEGKDGLRRACYATSGLHADARADSCDCTRCHGRDSAFAILMAHRFVTFIVQSA